MTKKERLMAVKVLTEGEAPSSVWTDFNMSAFIVRQMFSQLYGFVIPVTEVLDTLAAYVGATPVLEVGSGTGYFASRLALRGVPITCTDIYGNPNSVGPFGFLDAHMPIEAIGAAEAIQRASAPYPHVLMTWPDLDDKFGATAVAALHPGQVLIYNGESQGGCCGTNEMFRKMEALTELEDITESLNACHQSWRGIHDNWTVFAKPA